ncbi:MAG: hypothetical protein JXQ83_01970, partial [Candidatus Glassbacteria bacterium]|nr:hypothetical protein [Candidatus Glassbacteria bacterium]
MLCSGAVRAAHDEEGESGEYVEATLRGTLWETLIENGVNPTLWRDIFDYNRRYNKAFAKVKSAHRIPNGITIYIPSDWQGQEPSAVKRTGPKQAAVQDTVYRLGMPALLVRAGRSQRLTDVIQQFCLPAAIKDSRDRSNLVRNVRSDIRDYYHRTGRELGNYDRSYFIPLHLVAEHYDSLTRRVEAFHHDPSLFIPLDSLLGVSGEDLSHTASEGEDYRDLALRYIGPADDFPEYYPYKKSPDDHLAYMAQIIRHYNLNQPLWPGKTYFIPGYLLAGGYYRDHPEVRLVRRAGDALYYQNGLKVSLEYHVTRT